MSNNQPAETPLEDLRKGALEHYEKVTAIAHEWQSVIPKAINAYFDTLVSAGGASEAEQLQCYWCKHPDHGDKVCPVPYLARGEGGMVGFYPCGCTRSTVLRPDAASKSEVAGGEEK